MADWTDDEWDSPSSIGSPTSSLPQSVREVLESVRAECNADMFGGFSSSSNVEKPSSTLETRIPNKNPIFFPKGGSTEIDELKGTAKDLNDCQTEMDFDMRVAHENGVESPQGNEYGMYNIEKKLEVENTQSQEDITKRSKRTSSEHVHGQYSGIHSQQVDLLKMKREKLPLTGILAGYKTANSDHWIKIDCPAKKLRLENVKPIIGNRLSIYESETRSTLNSQEVGIRETHGKITQTEDHNERMEQDGLERGASTENEVSMSTLVEGSIKRADSNLQTENRHKIAIDYHPRMTSVNALMTVEKTKSLECSPIQKYVAAQGLQESINLSEVKGQQGAAHVNLDFIDLTESPESSESQLFNTIEERDEQRTSIKLEIKDRRSALMEKGSSASFGYCTPSIQNEMNLDSADDEIQTVNKLLYQDEPAKDENLHAELEEKYLNMHGLEDVRPVKREYQEYNSEYEEILKASSLQMMDVENIKEELFSDDEHQTTNRNEIYRNTKFGEASNAGFSQGSNEKSLMIWRHELLSSDFNLMYSNLRAILMTSLSNNDRHRLIKTMIATISEIEEVIMGEGEPVKHSVRCETPELNTNLEESGRENEEAGLCKKDEAKEESELVSVDPLTRIKDKMMIHDNASLRERETVLNEKRMRELTIKCFDGTLLCLVCKRVIPNDRVCKACSSFAYRIERNYTLGTPIPTCGHTNYAGSPRCKSCRFRKFCFMSMTTTDTRTREVHAKKCPVCRKTSYHRRGWKCMDCHNLFSKLRRRLDSQDEWKLPTCKHNGEYPDGCEGCRLFRLQEVWANHEPHRAYPLPLVKKHLTKCEV